MHELIASPHLGDYLVVRPGRPNGVKIPYAKYTELALAQDDRRRPVPPWLASVAQRAWDLELSQEPLSSAVLIRPETPLNYGRATWEINLGCDFDCEHCYLGEKRFEAIVCEDKIRLLHILRDAGVLWLQITGGEPLVDRDFPFAYELASDHGMMIEVLSNGSQLAKPRILDLLTTRKPYRLCLSVYGATAETYDALTRRRGAFARFRKGLTAAHEAGISLDLSIIITRRNAHEVDQMRAMAEELGVPSREYAQMSPTIYGGAETLPTQSPEHLVNRERFTGCNAGHTFFHVDPHGRASICKIGRDPNIPLMTEGVDGLRRLGAIADSMMLRTGGCSGCALSGNCTTCRPLAKLYQEAEAPLASYCQHGRR